MKIPVAAELAGEDNYLRIDPAPGSGRVVAFVPDSGRRNRVEPNLKTV